jgi:hypothetical protein
LAGAAVKGSKNPAYVRDSVFDHQTVVVSGMNWSGEGVLSNRDLGVVIENATAAAFFEEIFFNDWQTTQHRRWFSLDVSGKVTELVHISRGAGLGIGLRMLTYDECVVTKVVLSLAAAGIGAIIPGTISAKAGGFAKAGGSRDFFPDRFL